MKLLARLIASALLIFGLVAASSVHTNPADCHGPHDCGYSDNGHNGDK